MRRADLLSAMLALALAVAPTAARAQTPGPSAPAETAPAPPAPTEAAPEPGKTPSFRDEVRLFAYLEMSYTWNLGGASRGGVNELRVYDDVDGFTFNIAEFSVKKDPSERYPIGFGLVLTVGQDSQKNHSLGIFRDEDDEFPFRNTSHFDLQEAYLSVRIPLGTGLVIKAGKWVSLLGYEVIESPNNLNFSRGYLFNLAGPFTQTGVSATYAITDWISVAAGVVVGSDTSDDNNHRPSYGGGFQLTPRKDLTFSIGTIVGPEQNDNHTHIRWILDLVGVYTGIDRLTLAGEITGGKEDREASLVALNTRQDPDASWWGWGLWAAYDWTPQFRTALRQEYFKDADGARTGFGSKLSLWSTTLTFQYKIWRGLVSRLEYRHDQADERAFRQRYDKTRTLVPTSHAMDTISLSAYYTFF
jgi:hypothetical protein